MRVWDLETGVCLRVLEGHTAGIGSVSLTPDRRRAVSASRDKTVRVWDLGTGACLRVLEGHTDEVKSVSVTPDGRWAMSGSKDKTVRVWDLETGACLAVVRGDASWTAVAVAADGALIAGSANGEVSSFECSAANPLRRAFGHGIHTSLPRESSPLSFWKRLFRSAQ